ncbi:excalibur calcium-binding domain-containing protein [Peribacillus loiseleuriae]|uniref:Calcium-binding protein n=1 Tax=Peribacillus loiseleuriae TaxID=1679170 RepID=A0A0K9GSE4_9BACI|nr:excalibur calcium-binding domain-containing protein [Peribacillus loiseleuriae]KMY49609.1 calcium-binding protein [Peribacillus loiseleuriae]
MKKISILLFSGIILVTLSFGSQIDVQAAPKSFKNCTELNKVYKGGVSKSSTAKNVGGKTKYKPTVNAELYNANKKLDRDKDGIACER